MTEQNNEKNPIQVADRLFHTLETLSYEGSMGLLELSKHLNLNKSTTHRILNSLIYMGYVKQDPDTTKYRLSFKICELSNQLLTKIDIVEIAKPFLREIVSEVNETIHLVQREGISASYIDKVESYSNTIRMASRVGHSIPLYCSGVGKALLADMSDDKIQDLWHQSDIHKITTHTIVNFQDFMNEIRNIRSLGYALDNEENELGVRCIAVSIPTYNEKSTYAISISAPIDRMDDERILDLSKKILATRKKLSAALK